MQKPQLRAGHIETSNSDARSAFLYAHNHRWGLGTTENCNSSLKDIVLQVKNHRWGLEPIWTWYYCSKRADMSAQFHTLGQGTIQTCRSGPKVAVLHAKTSSEVCYPERIVIQGLKSLFCIHKATGDGRNPYRFDILVLCTPLCVLKTTDEGWDP